MSRTDMAGSSPRAAARGLMRDPGACGDGLHQAAWAARSVCTRGAWMPDETAAMRSVQATIRACPDPTSSLYHRRVAVTPHEELLADLNPAQREAVLHVEGPLLVVAGAGSGKTRVLTHRVAHLIRAHGVKPNEILAITFTNKAASEMRERLERTLGRTARAIWILTFHAACGRILRREAERLGYRSTFTIYDQADQVRVVKACLEELGKDPKRFTPRGIHSQISNAKNQLISPEEYASRVASFR